MNARAAHIAIVPFNRLETGSRDFAVALAYLWHRDPFATLRSALQDITGQQNIVFSPSGQCAIAQLLSVLPQREVVMPAYLCNEVKKAALIAGKRVIYVDLAKDSVNATSAEFAKEAKPGRILLAVHAYGVPTDIEAICDLARHRDCVTIEDAVPAFGSRRNGRLLGTYGDFGIFSFQHSKRVPALRGAAIIINNNQIVDSVKLAHVRLSHTKRLFPAGVLLYALAQNLATTPWVYRRLLLPLLPVREPLYHFLNKTRFAPAPAPISNSAINANELKGSNAKKTVPRTPYYTREMHPYQAELALRVLRRLDKIHQHIARLTSIYLQAFRDTPIQTFLSAGCDNGGLMRFPVALPGKDQERILQLARKRGLYLKVIWGRPLPEESQYPEFPNAVWTARNVILLPLYRALPAESAELLAQSMIEIQRNGS